MDWDHRKVKQMNEEDINEVNELFRQKILKDYHTFLDEGVSENEAALLTYKLGTPSVVDVYAASKVYWIVPVEMADNRPSV